MVKEIWKPVPGYSGYLASSRGRIQTPRGKMTVQTPGVRGCLRINIKGRMTYVHRLVGLAFLPNPENKTDINHKDGNTQNNRSENLEWATRSENVLHSFRTLGRTPTRGEKMGSAKLTEKQVLEIRRRARLGIYAALAREFGVGETIINDIVHRRKWRHL